MVSLLNLLWQLPLLALFVLIALGRWAWDAVRGRAR
jgi:hypothetical protein